MNDLKFSTYLQNKASELKVATIAYLKEKIIKIISVLFALAVAAINRYNRVDLDLFELQTKTMIIEKLIKENLYFETTIKKNFMRVGDHVVKFSGDKVKCNYAYQLSSSIHQLHHDKNGNKDKSMDQKRIAEIVATTLLELIGDNNNENS